MNKIYPSAAEALKGIVADGQLLAVGGFGLYLYLQATR